MTALLSLDRVSKRFRTRGREYFALRNVSLDVSPRQLVSVWDTDHVGSRLLLRIAAGIEPPDSGVVRFDGRDLAKDTTALDSGTLRYADHRFVGGTADTVLRHVMVPLRAQSGVSRREVEARAQAALERVGAWSCADFSPTELRADELLRVRLARALVLNPRMIVVDQPLVGIDPDNRDPVLALLRAIADSGVALLITVANPKEMQGVNHALQLDDGELISSDPGPGLARVVSLPLRRASDATS